MSAAQPQTEYVQTLERLANLSIGTYYNPYKVFEWPEHLEDRQWWMPQELLTVHGTPLAETLTEDQLMLLSKWESINFYSLNIHGIRELLLEVMQRIHSPGYEIPSEFFHHFIGEENEHMWFFATFCLKYGSKIYPDKRLKIGNAEADPRVADFLVFARILVFEEIVDFFNQRMGKDESLHPIIRQINSTHHQDESRHIAFGRQIVRQLYSQVEEQSGRDRLREIDDYVKRYINASIASLYNPAVYRDTGIDSPHDFRTELMQQPSRKQHHETYVKRTLEFFYKSGILSQEDFVS